VDVMTLLSCFLFRISFGVLVYVNSMCDLVKCLHLKYILAVEEAFTHRAVARRGQERPSVTRRIWIRPLFTSTLQQQRLQLTHACAAH